MGKNFEFYVKKVYFELQGCPNEEGIPPEKFDRGATTGQGLTHQRSVD
jgi:hypothetical protein